MSEESVRLRRRVKKLRTDDLPSVAPMGLLAAGPFIDPRPNCSSKKAAGAGRVALARFRHRCFPGMRDPRSRKGAGARSADRGPIAAVKVISPINI
jgi:hypothetical protein